MSDQPDGQAEGQTLFIHIPKAAGTSFNSFLFSHFAPDTILSSALWESIRKEPMAALGRYRLIAGHVGYELAFYLENPFIITILRHPFDRMCSVYEYLRALFRSEPGLTSPDPDIDALWQLWKVVVERPFEEFLESPEPAARAALLLNPQARQLAQSTPYLMTDLSNDSLRTLALSRLKAIDVVGCAEQFSETVEVMCHKRGWIPPGDYGQYRLNTTIDRPVRGSLSPAVRRKVEMMCSVDMELHEEARMRLRADLKGIS